MYKIIILIFLSWSCVKSLKNTAMETFQLDINDILRVDLMPTTFLMFDGGLESDSALNSGDETPTSRNGESELGDIPSSTAESTSSTVQFPATDLQNDFRDFNNAFSTMRFHRDKYNEYLCNNFLASQILSDVLQPGSSSNQSTPFSNRLGLMPITQPMFNSSTAVVANPRVYFDIGSQGYTNWLQKSSAFENANLKSDSRLDLNDGEISPLGNLSSMSGSDGRRNDFYDYHDSEASADYVEGDISGYMYQPKPIVAEEQKPQINPPHNVGPINPYLAINHGIEDIKHQNTEGRRTIHKGHTASHYTPTTITYPYGPVLLQDQVSHPVQQFFAPQTFVIGPGVDEASGFYPSGHGEHHAIHHDYKSNKSLGLKEIFEIALTTLAFLAFGMFMLQVIMCITMDPTGVDGSMVVTPMEGSDELDPITEEVRKKRAVPVANMERINELAKIVLASIESTYTADVDNGQCLYRTLCETNKFSRTTEKHKYWIPLWGLGMTWLSPRVIKGQPRMHSILDGIKASLLGLGNANCTQMYAKCNLQEQRSAKERRRKKRSLEGDFKFQWD